MTAAVLVVAVLAAGALAIVPLTIAQPAGAVVRPLLIIGSERTGSNYLCDLLNTHPQIAAYYEIFSNVGIMMRDSEVKALCEMQNWPFSGSRYDRDLISRFKDRPDRIIQLLEGGLPAGKEILSFKVFQNHLPSEKLIQLIQDYDVIAVTRRVIDSYISFVKATETDEWLRLDTTRIQPALHIDNFVDWYSQRHAHYKLGAEHYTKTHHRAIPILRYEEFTRGSNLENLTFVCEKIASSMGIELDNSLGTSDMKFKFGFSKQDKNASVMDKVANWVEFEQQLQERGLLEIAADSFLGPFESLYSSS
ncbi:MAG: hypothetical protein WA949_12985 [Phormidesmis sp.]